ncbi:hypothetical protein [Neisseria polysaccharea]|uniref:hypothetical protein n=1 Tax=Neisseria polysaccharea TaxID=489 RepID=UPI00272C1D15|nr:hypothetical protein [Neisseria polysaccharea]
MPSETISDGIFTAYANGGAFIIFKYCRHPKVQIPATFRHSRENGNLEPQTFR